MHILAFLEVMSIRQRYLFSFSIPRKGLSLWRLPYSNTSPDHHPSSCGVLKTRSSPICRFPHHVLSHGGLAEQAPLPLSFQTHCCQRDQVTVPSSCQPDIEHPTHSLDQLLSNPLHCQILAPPKPESKKITKRSVKTPWTWPLSPSHFLYCHALWCLG